jgi:tetratricopeptide (TPR) repeat protein
MGLLQRFFSGDPQRELERAEALLASGDVQRALEIARRTERRAPARDQERARALVERARQSLATEALQKASLAETSEYFEDAAEWVEVALEHVDDPVRRGELETLRQSLLECARKTEDEAWSPPADLAHESQTDLDSGIHYQALIDMLEEEVAERYQARPPTFRAAYIALNEGRGEDARQAFENLAAGAGEDPVIRFERGRSRLASGDAEGAASDFEAAWPELGDHALDLAGELSVPALWAEAMLALGRPKPVIERLAGLLDPIAAPPLCERYAQALLDADRLEAARDFLSAAIKRNPTRDLFAYQLAQALGRLGQRAAAIDCLEAAIAPSCASGCAPRARFLPSFRALAAFYLEDGSRPERVRELMKLVAQTLGGRITSRDHTLLAGYYEQVGDAEAAERARSQARWLQEQGGDQAAPSAPAPALGGMRAPL